MSFRHHSGSYQNSVRHQHQQQTVTTTNPTQPSYIHNSNNNNIIENITSISSNINNNVNASLLLNDNPTNNFCGSNNVDNTSGTVLGRTTSPLTSEIAIDCEMVEATKDGKKISVLARVSLVNSFCQLILDTYVKPMYRVSDYRTPYSGIRREHLENAPKFKDVRDCVVDIINGRILIGHDLVQDLTVLDIKNLPNIQLRDTSECYRSFFKVNERPSLKRLAAAILDRDIQRGAHDSIEDAMTAMLLYKYWQNTPPQEPKS